MKLLFLVELPLKLLLKAKTFWVEINHFNAKVLKTVLLFLAGICYK